MVPITRASFLGYAAASLSSALSLSFYCSNVRNDSLSSPPLTDDERRATLSLASRLIRDATSSAIRSDPAIAGPILRLAFHDAATREAAAGRGGAPPDGFPFTGGPNGSVRFELDWPENRGLSRPLEAVERIHRDAVGGSGVSFADAVAISGAAAVEAAGGPHVPVRMGREDASGPDPRRRRRSLGGGGAGTGTGRSLVETTLPSAGLDSDGLRLYFGVDGGLGLTEEEFVALCGAHDLGRHVTLLGMPRGCLKDLTRECLENAPVLMPFVAEDPDTISNEYFKKLLRWYERKVELGEVAFIPTDVNLVVDEGLREYVVRFANDQDAFFRAFAVAYQKMVDVTATTNDRY